MALILRFSLIAAGVVALGCAGAHPTAESAPPAKQGATQPPAGTPGGRDAQAAYEPRSAPGEGQKLLAKFVGEWDVVKTFYPRSGPPAVSRGTGSQRMV